jgi:hypothetical protein
VTIVGNCAAKDCGRPVEEHQDRIYAIRGYERTRSAGGTNHVLRKERLDGWVWHFYCWERAVKRRDRTGVQEALL